MTCGGLITSVLGRLPGEAGHTRGRHDGIPGARAAGPGGYAWRGRRLGVLMCRDAWPGAPGLGEQCAGLTASATCCRHRAWQGSGFCSRHAPQEDAA